MSSMGSELTPTLFIVKESRCLHIPYQPPHFFPNHMLPGAMPQDNTRQRTFTSAKCSKAKLVGFSITGPASPPTHLYRHPECPARLWTHAVQLHYHGSATVIRIRSPQETLRSRVSLSPGKVKSSRSQRIMNRTMRGLQPKLVELHLVLMVLVMIEISHFLPRSHSPCCVLLYSLQHQDQDDIPDFHHVSPSLLLDR